MKGDTEVTDVMVIQHLLFFLPPPEYSLNGYNIDLSQLISHIYQVFVSKKLKIPE
jgi:hypothetical protein